jgi:hypothetical protein
MTEQPSPSIGVDWFDKFIAPRIEVSPRGCWLWTGAKKPAGYGMSGPAQRATGTGYIHRAVWIALNGQPPAKHEVDHVCFVTSCVNPAHLRLLTAKENRQIGRRNWLLRTSHCRNGHAKAGDNLIVDPDGHTRCRICTHEAWRRGWTKKNAKRAAARRAAREVPAGG